MRGRLLLGAARGWMLVVAAVVLSAAPRLALAQHPATLSTFLPSCWVTDGAKASVYLRGCNETGDTITGVTPSPLNISATGTASLEMITMPTFRRVLVRKNCVNFRWQFNVNGCGVIDISGNLTAEDLDGVTWGTGETSCGQIIADGPECHPETPTPTWTPRARRPSPTPRPRIIVPTRTPRTRLASPTPRPKIIITPREVTPKARATLRPTRTPLFTRTPRLREPTPTRAPKLRPTLRPTRTPIPTRTSPPLDLGGFEARCIALTANAANVKVHLQVFNNTGGTLSEVVPLPLDVMTTGTAETGNVAGPTPRLWRTLLDGSSTRFEWSMRPSGDGQIFLHVQATAVTPDGDVISTSFVECNTLNVPSRVEK